jgi:hypothetical protein
MAQFYGWRGQRISLTRFLLDLLGLVFVVVAGVGFALAAAVIAGVLS